MDGDAALGMGLAWNARNQAQFAAFSTSSNTCLASVMSV